MNRKAFLLAILARCAVAMAGDAHAPGYPKVILQGDYADPTLLRDGADFYLTHSAFVYKPGFLIWHSINLVDWTPLVRAVGDFEGSAYAPDLEKVGDKYYLYFPSAGVNWVVVADAIRGPWSKPIRLDVGRIDPGLAVDEEGRRFLFQSGGYRVQLSADGLHAIGKSEHVYDGWNFPSSWKTEGKWLESPKLFKRGAYYYMVSAEGGTAGPPTSHMAIVARSKSLDGPWENSPRNPIVHTYDSGEEWWSKGHATIFDDASGHWWIIYHAYRKDQYPLGRQTLLEPVDWTADDWPVISTTGHPLPGPASAAGAAGLSDTFSGHSLGLQWTSWRTPPAVAFDSGRMVVSAKGKVPADGALMLVTAGDDAYQVEAEVVPGQQASGGLLLFYNEKAYVGVVSDGHSVRAYGSAGAPQEIATGLGARFWLRIVNRHNRCAFYASVDRTSWSLLLDNVDVSKMHHNQLHGFLALRPALVAIGQGTVGFEDFTYQAIE